MKSSEYKKPNVRRAMKKACDLAGGKGKLAARLGIKYQSMDCWIASNKMPATEFNGQTFYSLGVQDVTGNQVTITDLLGFIPHPQQWAMDDRA